MNGWVFAKGGLATLGYLNRADIPFQYALADAYTVGDAYHCSVLSATGPNRTYLPVERHHRRPAQVQRLRGLQRWRRAGQVPEVAELPGDAPGRGSELEGQRRRLLVPQVHRPP